MSSVDLEKTYVGAFADWLRTLGTDVMLVADAAGATSDTLAGELLVGALNHLFKAVDLVPDGIDDFGMLDDAFVLRTACAMACEHDASLTDSAIRALAEQAAIIREFLRADYPRLERFVSSMRLVTVHDQTAARIVADPRLLEALGEEVQIWARNYRVPAFSRSSANLARLHSFLVTRLPVVDG